MKRCVDLWWNIGKDVPLEEICTFCHRGDKRGKGMVRTDSSRPLPTPQMSEEITHVVGTDDGH